MTTAALCFCYVNTVTIRNSPSKDISGSFWEVSNFPESTYKVFRNTNTYHKCISVVIEAKIIKNVGSLIKTS